MEHRIHVQKLISRNEQGYTKSILAAVQIQFTGLTTYTSLLVYNSIIAHGMLTMGSLSRVRI